jgi:hypothetical protein
MEPTAHTPYPDFSAHVIQDLIGVVRGGELAEQTPLALKCCWEVAGAGLKATVGEPDEHETFGSEAPASYEEVKEAAALMKSEVNLYAGEKAIGPLAAILIQAAVEALLAWLNKKKSEAVAPEEEDRDDSGDPTFVG